MPLLQTRLNNMELDFKKFLYSLAESVTNKSDNPVVEEVKDEVPTMKAFDEDKRLFTAVVLRPEVVDSHGDIYSHEVVEKACHDYNTYCRQGNYEHMINTDDVVMVESWIAKADMQLGDGDIIEGDWVMTVKVQNDTAWEMCKSGEFAAFSIGSISSVEVLKGDEDSLSEWASTLTDMEETDGS